MKNTLPLLFLATAILLPGRATAAEPRLATINVEKTFKDYWRTGVEEKRLKKEVDAVNERVKTEDKKQSDLLKELQNMDKMRKAPNLGQAERARRNEQFATKQRIFEQNAGVLNNWKAAQQKDLDMKRRKAFEKIREEIRSVIAAQAKKNGFTAVVDSKALLYSSADLDITTKVIAQLNVNDPGKVAAPKKK